MACGFPFTAEGQAGPLYPFHLAYLFLPFIAVYTWSIPLHFLLGGAGMYGYARSLGLSREASGLASTVFAFGSGFAGCYYNVGSLRTLAWLPWALILLVRMRSAEKPKKTKYCALLALIFFLQWTAGFSQIAAYAFFYCFLHEIPFFVMRDVRRDFKPLLFLAASLMLGTALAAPQIAATAELIPLSIREGESIFFALWGSAPPAALVSLIFPQWGNALRLSFYVGIVPLMLAVFMAGFIFEKGQWRRHVLLALFFFLLALGRFNPVYRWVVETFSLTLFRNPSKFLFFSVTSLSILAAFGLDRLIRCREDSENAGRWKKIVYGFAATVALLPALGATAHRLARSFWPAFSDWYVAKTLAEKGAAAKPSEYYVELMRSFFESAAGLFSLRNPFTLNAILFTAATAMLVHLFFIRKLQKKAFLAFLFVLLTADLYVFGLYLGTGFIGNAGSVGVLKEPAVVSLLRQNPRGEQPVVELVSSYDKEVLPPNLNMLYGVTHAGGYTPLLLKKYYEMTYDLGLVDGSLGKASFSESVWTAQREVLDVLGVRYIRADRRLSLERVHPVRESGGEWVYENESPIPKIAGYYHWRLFSPDEGLSFMKSGDFNPQTTVVLSKVPSLSEAAIEPRAYEEARIRKDDLSGEIDADIAMKRDGVVFARVNAYPGWSVKIDGRAVPWFDANHAFIGFEVPKGQHRLQLHYTPSWFLGSLAVSAAALLIVCFLFFRSGAVNR